MSEGSILSNRLVVLSACETGLIDFKNSSDEYIGLPSGFLYAGRSSVVSHLSTVGDLSTAFLMIKFFQNLQAATNISVPLALMNPENGYVMPSEKRHTRME